MLEEGQRKGVFRARPAGAGGLSRAKTGSMQVAVILDVLDNEGVAGPQITWFGSLSPGKATEITLEALRTLGWTGDDVSDLSMISNEVSITVEKQEWEGKTFERVTRIGDGSGIPNMLDEGEAKAFAATLKSQVRAFDAVKGKPKVTGAPTPRARSSKPAETPEPPPITDDDSLPQF